MPETEVRLSKNIEHIWGALFRKGKEVDHSLVSVKAKFTEVSKGIGLQISINRNITINICVCFSYILSECGGFYIYVIGFVLSSF